MVIIKCKPVETKHTYYRVDCSCGCVFEIIDTELSGFRTPYKAPVIVCPNCKKQIETDDMCVSKISKEQYEYDYQNQKEFVGLVTRSVDAL